MQMTLKVVQLKEETVYPGGWTEPAEQVVFVTVDVVEEGKTSPSGTLKFKATGDERIGDKYSLSMGRISSHLVPEPHVTSTSDPLR